MIRLKELFTSLATGEFSNISLQRDRSGQINESEYAKVLSHINLGLIELCKRFNFLEEELILHVDPSVSTYYIRPDRMALLENITTESYIEKPPDHSGDINIVEIKAIFDEDGYALRINDRHATPCILHSSTDTLRITGLEAPQKLSIVFQSHPPRIDLSDAFDPDNHTIPLPETVIEPLLYYVASRVYKPMGANNSTANADKSAGYQQQYELACQKITTFGLDIENSDCPDTFTERGWV